MSRPPAEAQAQGVGGASVLRTAAEYHYAQAVCQRVQSGNTSGHRNPRLEAWHRQVADAIASVTEPPSAPVGVELSALRVQEWLQREYDILPPVQEIEQAMRTPCSCPDTERALAQHPAAVFRDDGNSEADFIADDAIACTACGGSGHRDDQQPAAVDEAMVAIRKLARDMKRCSLDGATRSALRYSDDLREYADRLLALAAQQGGRSDD